MKRFKRATAFVLAALMILTLMVPGTVTASAAGVDTYISGCTAYSAYLTVETTASTTLMSYPCSASTNSGSSAVKTVASGTVLTATALYKNTAGEYWYKVSSGSTTCYVKAADTAMVSHLTGDVTADNVLSPASLAYGSAFSIEGTIAATTNKLTAVTAAMYNGASTAGTPSITASDSVSGNSYDLKGSNVDYNLAFNALAAGTYTYLLTADALSYYIDDSGKLAEDTKTVVLKRNACVVTDVDNPNKPTAFGIDVSVWNGDIDWTKVKNEVDFAILRIGYEYTLDTRFLEYVQGCIDNDIPYGVYIYSYAESWQEGVDEAKFVINTLEKYDLHPYLPIWFDMEDAVHTALSTSEKQAVVQGFCDTILDAGYQPGLYTFISWFNSYFYSSYYDSLPQWVAQIDNYTVNGTSSYAGGTHMWQYSWEGTISGISGNVDCNYYYADFNPASADGYASTCDSYPAYCQFKTTRTTPINTQPCSAGNNGSETLENLTSGKTWTAIGLYRNGGGNLWYQVESSTGETGYVYAGHTTYVTDLTDDITLTGASAPSLLNQGDIFYVEGTISSDYNDLTNAAVWVKDSSGNQITGGADSVSANSYSLMNSAIDSATAFNQITAGDYTYDVAAKYVNYYASDATTLGTNTGTVSLLSQPFTVEASGSSSGSGGNSTTYSGLDCSGFISDPEARNYINTMMNYYIANYDEPQWDLAHGTSVVFMFEGGSDNYNRDSIVYQDAVYTTRTQAVCIVVQADANGDPQIVFNSEYCSSIPDDANWTSGGAYDNSTTLMDGMYEMYTCNHNGQYAAFTTNCYTAWYSPYDDGNGWSNSASGINIHTRGSDYCGGQSAGYAQSAGCQLIGWGASASNSFNAFMKTVAGITWNSYAETKSTFSSVGTYKGTYIVDRQLGLVSPDGTEYGSGSLRTLYSKYDLDNITAFSTTARAGADFSVDYVSTCTGYPAHCRIRTKQSTPINTQPCSAGNNSSSTIQTLASGTTWTAIGLYQNTAGNLWYQVEASNGTTGYIFAGHTNYVEDLTSDITLTGASSPSGHVAGSIFYVEGTVASQYNRLTDAEVWIRKGFGTDGAKVTGGSDTVSGNSYSLKGSSIDNATAFNEVSAGKYTYVVSASYKNYYASNGTTLGTNTGTVDLLADYFVIVNSSVDQSTCSHSYTTTVIEEATCTENGIGVDSCSKCGKIVDKTIATDGHDWGSWSTVKAVGCTTDGSKARSCTVCGEVEQKTVTATGHDYQETTVDATCKDYAHRVYTCDNCGDSYTGYNYTEWTATKPEGVDEALIESKTEYRYADYETTTSGETSLSGWNQVSSEWTQTGTGTVNYVNSWPSGFSTSSANYSTYNKKSSKVTASETATAKTVVNSDKVVGYLYYHWCYANSFYSMSYKTGSYTTFHSFYSTQKPSECADYDSGDGSYLYPNTSCCTNSEWYWPVEVYAQNYTTYKKLFTYERWTDWTDWSEEAVTATDTRKVESRTLYRYLDGELGDHNYVNGVCDVCGDICSHSWDEGTCGTCGTVCGHNWQNGTCGTCGMDCEHSYENGVCTTCGTEDPNWVLEYYLIGYINGADYGCEDDYANLGEYKFVDGTVTATFNQDSYVFVKASDNNHWYMTDGWQGTETTSVTLYNTEIGLSDANKLYVPGNVEVTFTLTDNGDDTFTLSYTVPQTEPEKFDISFASMTMGNSLAINFAFEKGHAADWTGHYAEIVKEYADGRENVVQTVQLSNWKSTNINGIAHYYVTFNGIAAKEMTDDVSVTIYNAEGEAVSNTWTDSVRAQAMRNLAKATIGAEEKTMVVDMLNYGAAAQQEFQYNTADLATAQLSEAQKALATEGTTYEDAHVGTGNYVASNLMLKSNTQLMFAFRNVTSDMKAVVTFTNHRGVAKNITIEGSEFTKSGSLSIVTVEDMVIADSRQDITCTIYDGETVVAAITDSAASYAARKNNNLFEMLMRFSDSAYAYFH